jgi:hypothetical protein
MAKCLSRDSRATRTRGLTDGNCACQTPAFSTHEIIPRDPYFFVKTASYGALPIIETAALDSGWRLSAENR